MVRASPSETVAHNLSTSWTAANTVHPITSANATPTFSHEGSAERATDIRGWGTVRCWTLGQEHLHEDIYAKSTTRKERVAVQVRTGNFILHHRYRTEVDRIIGSIDQTVVTGRLGSADVSDAYHRATLEGWNDITMYPGGEVSTATVLLQTFWEDRLGVS